MHYTKNYSYTGPIQRQDTNETHPQINKKMKMYSEKKIMIINTIQFITNNKSIYSIRVYQISSNL